MPDVYLSPVAGAGGQFFTSAGAVLSGGLLYTYAAGTTTPETTYSDSAGTQANTNPIVLNSACRPSVEIWLTRGTGYKFALYTSLSVSIWSQDNIFGVGTLDAPIFTGNATAATQTAGNSSTQLATTGFVAGGFGPLASPTFTGTPTAPTAAVDTATTQIATTAYVVNQAYAKLASPVFTGNPTGPPPTVGASNASLATTQFVALSFAPLLGPTFTGVPAAPTAIAGANSTQIATTAYVDSSIVSYTTATMENSFTHGAGQGLVFRQDRTFVDIWGSVVVPGGGATSGTTVTILPSGYRPQQDIWVPEGR